MYRPLLAWNHLQVALLLVASVALLGGGAWLTAQFLGLGMGLWLLGAAGLLIAGLTGSALDARYGERNREDFDHFPRG